MDDATRNRLLFGAGLAGACLAGRTIVRNRRYLNPEGKVALITGGSRGLGFVLARQLGDRGARIAICARDESELQRAKAELQSHCSDLLTIVCDLTAKPQVDGMIEGVLTHFKQLDILINNAGVISVGPSETMTLGDYQEAINTHFYGPLYTTLAALPHMRQRQSGRIVNISSIGGLVPTPHLLPYVASKFALTGFSQGLRTELLKDNIFVTSVFPGLMRTGSPRNAIFKGQHKSEYAWFKIADSLPLLSMSAERAAVKIIDAFTHGRANLTLTPQAKIAARLHALMPDLIEDVAALFNYLLPGPGGLGPARLSGAESESPLTRSGITTLTDAAAQQYNESGWGLV